jgi:hypothetical protein
MELLPYTRLAASLPCIGQWLANCWISVAEEKGKNGCVTDCSLMCLLAFFLDLQSTLDIGLGPLFQTNNLS